MGACCMKHSSFFPSEGEGHGDRAPPSAAGCQPRAGGSCALRGELSVGHAAAPAPGKCGPAGCWRRPCARSTAQSFLPSSWAPAAPCCLSLGRAVTQWGGHGGAPGARGCEEQGLCRWPLSGGSWLSEIKSEPERSKGLESQQELQIGIES